MHSPTHIEQLLDDGQDLESRDDEGLTPLLAAIAGPAKAPDKKRLVTRLLKAGVDLRARDAGGRSALDLAVASSSLPLITALVKAGLDVDDRDDDGRTALMKLNQKDSKVYKVATLLKELGADPEARCRQGRTAIFYAALAADHLGMACYALQAIKVRVDVKDNDGATVVELCAKKNPSMLGMLRRNLAEQTGAPPPPEAPVGPGGYRPPS